MSRLGVVDDQDMQPLRAVRTQKQCLLNIRCARRTGDPVNGTRQGAGAAIGILTGVTMHRWLTYPESHA